MRSQKERTAQKQTEHEENTEAADLKNKQLDDDVACCLADIDCCLAETDTAADELSQAEKEALWQNRQKEREAAEKDWYAGMRKHPRAWKEKYSHLGAYTVEACCADHPAFSDDDFE